MILTHIYDVDISQPLLPTVLQPMMVTGDKMANRVGVRLKNGNQDYTPDGSCRGYVLRADGATVPILDGVVNGNEMYIDLPEAAYAVQGSVVISIVCVTATAITTLFLGSGTVNRSQTDVVIDPGNVIDDISTLIQEIETAVASIPQDYSTLSANMAALTHVGLSITGNYIAPDGTQTANAEYHCTDFIPCNTDSVLILRGFFVGSSSGSALGYAFYSASKAFISGQNNINGDVTVTTIPSGAAYVRFSSRISQGETPVAYVSNHVVEDVANLMPRMDDAEADVADLKSATDELEDAVALTAKSYIVYTGNIVDTSGVIINSSGTPSEVILDAPGDGEYYENPFVKDNEQTYVYFLDASGNVLTLTDTDSSSTTTYLTLASDLYKFTISGTTVKLYSWQYMDYYEAGTPVTIKTYSLPSVPAKWKIGGRWWTSKNKGFTTYMSTTYVPYAPASHRYEYADELVGEINGLIPAIDATLSIEGDSADAKATGDAIEATSPDKIRGVNTGTIKGNYINPEDVTFTGDNTNAFSIDFPGDGLYYLNPFTLDSYTFVVAFLDENDDVITLTNTSTQATSTNITRNYLWWFKVDGTTVKTYSCQYVDYYKIGNASVNEYTLASAPAKMQISGRWWPDSHVGLTAYASATYVPYGDRVDYYISDTVTDQVHNLPVKELLQTTPTYNIVDNTRLKWDDESIVYMEDGYYIPVDAGAAIISTHGINKLYTYDSDKVLTQNGFTKNAYTPYTVPSGCAYVRFEFKRGSSFYHEVTENGELISVYVADERGVDDFRLPVPYKQIDGVDISTALFQTPYTPSDTSALMDYLRYQMVREINKRDGAFRIGNFNIYITRGYAHWETIRRELMDQSVDIVGFEEVKYGSSSVERRLPDFLKSWQFPYGSNHTPQAGMFGGNRALVSHWNVLSTTDTVFPSNSDNSYLKCVIQLPHYRDYRDTVSTSPMEFTLSVYVYHGTSSKGETVRLEEINDILSDIATDTADFVVVVGDVNAFNKNPDGTRPEWEAWKAGGFTPVIDNSNVNTVTGAGAHSDICPFDNIFYGNNITCKGFNVVRSSDYLYENSPSATDVVSDHDLIYADLAFDFQAVVDAKVAEAEAQEE